MSANSIFYLTASKCVYFLQKWRWCVIFFVILGVKILIFLQCPQQFFREQWHTNFILFEMSWPEDSWEYIADLLNFKYQKKGRQNSHQLICYIVRWIFLHMIWLIWTCAQRGIVKPVHWQIAVSYPQCIFQAKGSWGKAGHYRKPKDHYNT